MVKDTHRYEIGGMGEYSRWSVFIGQYMHFGEGNAAREPQPCEHCVKLDKPVDSGHIKGYYTHVLPYGVHALNEGGYNGTLVCLQCILKVAKELEVK